MVTMEDNPKQPTDDPDNVTKANVAGEVRTLASGWQCSVRREHSKV